jgi:hypothetical protein
MFLAHCRQKIPVTIFLQVPRIYQQQRLGKPGVDDTVLILTGSRLFLIKKCVKVSGIRYKIVHVQANWPVGKF